MTNLFGKCKKLAGNALNSLLFAKEEADGQEMPGSQTRYKFFNTKNNRPPNPANGSTRPPGRSSVPLMGTPRLSNPEQDRTCPNCERRCSSLKCSVCGHLLHEPYVSPLRTGFKPIRPRSMAADSQTSAGPCVDLEISDDEEPIPVTEAASNGSIFVPPAAVTITPVSSNVVLKGQQLYLGSIAATADVEWKAADIKLKSLSVRNRARPEKYNVNFPTDDCKLFYYAGPDSSHADVAIYVFIKMSMKSATDLMEQLAFPWEAQEYRLDLKDADESYHYVALKTSRNVKLRNLLTSYPTKCATQLSRKRAQDLFSGIKAKSDYLYKMTTQLEDIRSSQKDRFDLLKEILPPSPSSSRIQTPLRSYSGFARRSLVPRNPEVIDLDSDEMSSMAISSDSGTPPPKRNRCVFLSFESELLSPFLEFRGSRVSGDDDTVMARYPPHSSHPVTVLKADLKCLQPGEYLNDNILDFYLK